jgi:hypothetical protein
MPAYRPGSRLHVPRPGPAPVPGPAPPYPARRRRYRTAAARTRSAHPGPAARQGRRPAPRRGRAPGTGDHRPGRRGSPTWWAPTDCATDAAARPGTRRPGSRARRRRKRGRQRGRQADDVHAAGGRLAVVGQGRAAGDHPGRVPVHVGPMLFQQLFAQPHRAGPIAVVAEELHAHSLDHHAGDRTTPQPIAEAPVTPPLRTSRSWSLRVTAPERLLVAETRDWCYRQDDVPHRGRSGRSPTNVPMHKHTVVYVECWAITGAANYVKSG